MTLGRQVDATTSPGQQDSGMITPVAASPLSANPTTTIAINAIPRVRIAPPPRPVASDNHELPRSNG